MSIPLKSFKNIEIKYEKIRQKVINAIGVDVVNDNHYGDALLFNQVIDLQTDDNKIKEIWDRYVDIYRELASIFKENRMELKEEYFSQDPMSGRLGFLGVTIDVYKGFELLEPVVTEFITLYKKVLALSLKYSNLGKFMFEKDCWSGKNVYYLYKQEIHLDTEDYIIENILSSFDTLNKTVNELLEVCDYRNRDILYPYWNNVYYLFGKKIKQDISFKELIKIINAAQQFETNVERVIDDLKIIEKYTIIYDDGAHVTFGGTYHGFDINMSFEEIKKDFIETDKWCHFKKSV